ncbi:hypothetical protein [Candidatus Halobonum tyrrellensis]|uniref:Uncharacterized protein n=1 Tax=Candidatus Halobonum tyrrellensis G22 TaxID=1324957 RepID=V4HDP3_9EURY|nr:hypothetical protein [Candidatus Halobonum tyrrellensis]ESP88203.1 hypothetical protein K933_10345 [Candidatus Halobonum tyrrellensis G22]
MSADDAESDVRPGDATDGQVGRERAAEWFLLTGRRRVAAGLIAAVFFAGVLAVARVAGVPVRTLVAEKNTLWWVFSPMIGAVVTGVTLVITISQLILSQELGSLGDQRERMEGSMEFRDDANPRLDSPVGSADPASFMRQLLDGVRARADSLGAAVADAPDTALHAEVDEYVDAVSDDAARASEVLEDATFGGFDVMYGALTFNYSWRLYQGRRLVARHGDAFDSETRRLLDELLGLLRLFGPAREHFKTLYFQWELVNLSRVLLLSSVPALFVAVTVQLFVNGSSFPGALVGVERLTWVLAAGVTVTLLPFFLLLTYVIRVATVTKRTLAIGPFVLRNTDRDRIDWETDPQTESATEPGAETDPQTESAERE